MSPSGFLDKIYSVIMQRLVATGQAPHFTEIALELGIGVEEARKGLHDLMAAGVAGIWLFPHTDYISSFAPFSNLPTQYRITVEGEQKWFGQWGFESLAVCWLFPGKVVQINASCLDCGGSMQVEIQDGTVIRTEPEGVMAYVAVPFSKWFEQLPYAWSTMNLFRSEEHIRNWGRFDPATAEGIVPLEDMARLFSGNLFRRRLDPDYVARSQEYLGEFLSVISEVAKARPFWTPVPR
jgi:hypothetical protein